MKTRIILLLLTYLLSLSSADAGEYRDTTLRELTLEGDNIFSGTVYIEGRVTVNDSATLTITEGTRVIFRFIDTDNDGIGESEILSQGKVMVSGTEKNPVIFCSDRKEKGSWLGFSIMSVDNQSVFNYVIFEDSYMALHSHFSNIKLINSVFRNNLRGFQSQEGDIEIMGCVFYNNNTALQFRNSRAFVSDLIIRDNLGGMNFLYSQVEIKNIRIINNSLFGLKVRMSKAHISELTVSNSMQNIYGRGSEIYAKKIKSELSSLRGVSFEGSKVVLEDSIIFNNLLDGISLDNSNLETANIILENNGRFDIYLKAGAIITGIEKKEGVKIFEHK